MIDLDTARLLLKLVDRCKRLQVIERIDRAILRELQRIEPRFAVELALSHEARSSP